MRLRRIALLVVLVPAALTGSARAADEPPTITELRPASGPATGGTDVVVLGTGFTGAKAVLFGAEPATSFTVSSDSELEATAPPGSGAVDVTVETSAGTSAAGAPDRFSYSPVVTGLTPSAGSVSGGGVVTIEGAGFENVTGVSFGGKPAGSFTVESRTKITAVPQAADSGSVDVRVTTATGTSATSPGSRFSFQVAVSGLSPSSGLTGAAVTVAGIGFATARTVRFGAAATGFAVVSDSELLAVVPPGEGTVDVVVETAYGSTQTGSESRFSYGSAPGAGVAGVVTPTTPVGSARPSAPASGTRPGTSPEPAKRSAPERLEIRLPALIVKRPRTARVRYVAARVSVTRPASLLVEVRGRHGARLPFLLAGKRALRVQRLRVRSTKTRVLVLRIPRGQLSAGALYRVQITAVDDRGRRARRIRSFRA